VGHFAALSARNPPYAWPSGGAGECPNGTDKFSSNIDIFTSPSWHWDTYSYWPEMHPSTACWGNEFNPSPATAITKGQWICVELMIKANRPVTQRNGELAFWIDGVKGNHIGPGFPNGYWVADSFYPNAGSPPFEGFLWRTVEELAITCIHLGHGTACRIWYDDAVVATNYIGPIATAPDTVPPTVGITIPTSGPAYSTYLPSITVGGTASDDRGIVRVEWDNATTGGSGVAVGLTSWSAAGIPLAQGANAITVTAVDAGTNAATDTITITRLADTEGPAVSIAEPTSQATFETYGSTVNVAGTASDNAGIATVVVSNAGRWSATATGTTNWRHNNVPLAAGANTIIVKAVDTAGLVATDTVVVTRISGNGPPTVAIAEPTSGDLFTTTNETVALAGTASDDTGIADVTWTSSRGGGGTALGTTSWSVASVTLLVGTNVLTVTAQDTGSATGSDSITVVRNVPDGDDGGTGDDDGDNPAPDPDPMSALLGSEGSQERVYRIVTPEAGSSSLYVGMRDDDPSAIRLRLLSPLGEVVGDWDGLELDSVPDRDGVARIDLAGLGIATGTYLVELTVGKDTQIVPVVVLR
jgi:hypothetical protein